MERPTDPSTNQELASPVSGKITESKNKHYSYQTLLKYSLNIVYGEDDSFEDLKPEDTTNKNEIPKTGSDEKQKSGQSGT